MDDKRFFSRVGFSYFMMVVLTVAVQFLLSLLVSLIAPQAAGLPVTSWLLAMVPLYLVAIPVCAKMMQALPNMQLYRNEMRPGQWIRTLYLYFCDVCGKYHWKCSECTYCTGDRTGFVL